MAVILALTIITSYLIGSINASIVLSSIAGKGDIREHGSGNAGATNMLRTHGVKAGVATLIIDGIKGAFAVFVSMGFIYVARNYFEINGFFDNITYIAGISAIIGHVYPVFFHFKGGKGVITSAIAMLAVDWTTMLPTIIITLIIMAASKYVSLGSICAGIIYVIMTVIKQVIVYNSGGDINVVAVITSILIAALLIYKHKDNIKRLINGTESKLGSKKK